jgi:hypothetical protein
MLVTLEGTENSGKTSPPLVLRIIGIVLGLISILGGVAALGYENREPERYLVSALVMICSGILWFLSSIFPKFHLHKKEYILILAVLFLGLTIGLFSTFVGCGGECGGTGACTLHLGYPGRWLEISRCMAGSNGEIWWVWIMKGYWRIDYAGFLADIVFWCGIGVILLSFRNLFNSKTLSTKI